MCKKNINLRIIVEYVINFVLCVHDGVGVRLVADATLEASKAFTLIMPDHLMKIHDAKFFHVVTAVVIAIYSYLGDMCNIGEWQKVFSGEVTKTNNELNIFVDDSLADVDLRTAVGQNEGFHSDSLAYG